MANKKLNFVREFNSDGESWWVNDPAAKEQIDVLPPLTFMVNRHELRREFYLTRIDAFTVPDKIYGSVKKIADRILHTYQHRDGSTGAVFSGEKGSGKTLTSKLLSVMAAKLGMPTIVINMPWHGDQFNEFIQQIHQPCLIIFDEFEKVYDGEEQESMLTLLDGVFPTKKLFLITCNDKYKIDQHMLNRPSRVFYNIDFSGVEKDFIREYCEENLENKNNIDGVMAMSHIFTTFNFDMLKSLVEEMNRFKETAMEAAKYLNTKPEAEFGDYEAELDVDGEKVECKLRERYINPLKTDNFDITITVRKKEVEMPFSMNDLKMLNGAAGEYIYVRQVPKVGKVKLTLRKQKPQAFTMERLLV